jgi:transposase
MARFKHYDYGQMKLIPVSFRQQILPGTFEYTLSYLIDHEVDLTVFEHRYCNDETGAPAYDPAILLKIILYAYSRGVISSRRIERLCRENVVFMALSADSAPHFTTIADFIARLDAEITAVFRDVLLVCEEAGLIGREMFAVDGVKLPSNASKQWSGTRADFAKKVEKMERAVRYLVRRHREADDEAGEGDAQQAARAKQIDTLKRASRKVKAWLKQNGDKPGAGGRVRKSNITDNESAKMKTGKGVIQGYDGVTVTDAKHQVVVHAAAYGEAQEHGLLIPMLEGTRENFRVLGGDDVLDQVAVAADSGFHSEANVKYLFDSRIDGYLADTLFRKRDPRFATAHRHVPTRPSAPWARPLKGKDGERLFLPRDFVHDHATHTCICPAGEFLYQSGAHCRIGGREAVRFKGAKRVCGPCALRTQCLRHPERTAVRQVAFFTGHSDKPETYTAKMKRKIDTEHGRYQYGRRLAVAEPVFASTCSARGLKRFSHRGRRKVNTQWLLYCLVHNIGKVQRYGNLERRRRRKLQ